MPDPVLEVILTVPDSPQKAGELVPVSVTIRNISSEPVWMVGNIDGSETGFRFPYFLPYIKGPQPLPPIENLPWCGIVAPLRIQDFHLLHPGEDFNPCDNSICESYLPLITFSSFCPVISGRYELSLTLSTKSINDEEWLGIIEYPGKEQVLERLKLVPRITTLSNTSFVRVK